MEEKICELWRDRNISQALIAALCNVPPSYVYKIIAANFTVEERADKKIKLQKLAQTEVRVAPPSWYTGPGRSVPLKIIEYCEEHSITEIPPGMSVTNSALVPTHIAKIYNELHTLLAVQQHDI